MQIHTMIQQRRNLFGFELGSYNPSCYLRSSAFEAFKGACRRQAIALRIAQIVENRGIDNEDELLWCDNTI